MIPTRSIRCPHRPAAAAGCLKQPRRIFIDTSQQVYQPPMMLLRNWQWQPWHEAAVPGGPYAPVFIFDQTGFFGGASSGVGIGGAAGGFAPTGGGGGGGSGGGTGSGSISGPGTPTFIGTRLPGGPLGGGAGGF